MGGDPSKTLSQKLDQGSGVICPPDVDPAIKAPTPDAGKTPVIPPPAVPAAIRKCSRNKSPCHARRAGKDQMTYCRNGG
jgi:hypothetical protein